MNTTNKSQTRENLISAFWNRYKVQISLFLGVFGTKVILNLCLKSLTLSTGNDDIGTIAGAAYFAGLDWSDVISHTLYYGWGYSMFMAPVFMLTDNVRILFQAMLAYNALLLALSVVICYNIIRGVFQIEDGKFCITVSLAANFFFFALIDNNIIFNETPLIFLFWLVLYILLKMQRNIYTGRSNTWFTVSLVFIMGYGLTVHTRFLIMWGAIVVMVLVFALMKKKLLVNPWIFVLGAGGFYFIANTLNHKVQDGLWLAGQSDKPLVNSVDSLSGQFSNIKELFNSDGFAGFMHMILGQSAIMFFFTGGLMLMFILAAIIVIKRMFQKACSKQEVFLVTDKEERMDIQLGSGIIFIAALLMATLLMVNIGAAGVAKTAIIKGWGSKWFVYSRYWGACCPMAILLIFTFFYVNKEKHLKKKISLISLIGMTVWGILFGIFVAVKMVGVKISSALVFQVMMGLTFNGIDDRFSMSNMIYMLIFGGVWFLLLLILFYKKKYNSAVIVTMLIFVYIFAYKMAAVDMEASEEAYYQYIDAKWTLESYGIGSDDYKKIYVDSELSDYYNAQFELSRYELIVRDYKEYAGLQQEDSDIQLALTEQIGEEMCGNWYILYQKNQTEEDSQESPRYYLLVRNGELADKLVQQGVNLTDIREIYGMEKLVYRNYEKDIRNIGIDKLRNTDTLEQDFDITSDMIKNSRFAIALMFRNPSGNPSKGKVNVTITQGTLQKSYFTAMDTISTREWVYFYVDSLGFKEGKATITMTCPDMSQYKYVLPYTVASEAAEGDTGYLLRLNQNEYKGQLYMQIFIPSSAQGISIAPVHIAGTDKSAAKTDVGSLGNGMKLTQKISLTEEMLAYKYIGMDFWVKNNGNSESKGEITIKVTQGQQSDTFIIAQSDIASKDYMRIVMESKKYSAGEAVITMVCRGVEDGKYVKPYVCTYSEDGLPTWITAKLVKDRTEYDSYLNMSIYGLLNTYSSNFYR